MNQKRLNKIIKRDKRRKRAQRIGAGAGTVTSLLVLYLMFGRSLRKNK